MNKRELVLSVLERMGIKTEVDKDGDIFFRYQLKHIFVLIGNEEDQFLSVLLPQFYEIEEGEDSLVLAACNKTTREIKLVKVFVDYTFKNVSASTEFYYSDEASLEDSLSHALRVLGIVRREFNKKKDELAQ